LDFIRDKTLINALLNALGYLLSLEPLHVVKTINAYGYYKTKTSIDLRVITAKDYRLLGIFRLGGVLIVSSTSSAQSLFEKLYNPVAVLNYYIAATIRILQMRRDGPSIHDPVFPVFDRDCSNHD